MYELVVFAHVAFAFLFVLAHGTSVFAALRLRTERDPGRIAAVLDVSRAGLNLAYLGLLGLLIAGIAAGFMGNHWGRLWIWVSLGTVVVLWGLMGWFGSRYYNDVRIAVGIPSTWAKKGADVPPPRRPGETAALLESPRPYWLAGIGGVGLLILLWLMYYQPF